MDHFKEISRYTIPRLSDIWQFVQKNDCLALPNGQIDIDGEDLFVKIMEYNPKPASENKFETHRIYADLQYIASGVELMRIAPSKSLTSVSDYDAKGDYQFYSAQDDVSDLVVRAGQFTVFFPGEAHSPSCLYQNVTDPVKKLVFKIKIQ